MSTDTASSMGIFERFLSVWVALCITVGVGLGILLPEIFQLIASIEYASVNLVVAVFIWLKSRGLRELDLEATPQSRQAWAGCGTRDVSCPRFEPPHRATDEPSPVQ